MRRVRTRERAAPAYRINTSSGLLESWHPRPLHRAAAAAALVPLRRLGRSVAVEVAVCLAVAAALAALPSTTTVMQLSPPPPPAGVCGSSALNGPSSPPGGAVTVPAGDNSAFNFSTASTTYWFAPGTHTVGTGQFSQIDPGANDTLMGAPGAVLDGQGLNNYAITGNNTGITVEYLTIEHFTPPGSAGVLNENGIQDWTIQYNTVEFNTPGAATMLGTNNVLQYNCLTQNGEYAFNAFSVNDVSSVTDGPSSITVANNEMSFNDTCNWEAAPNFPITPPAGCAGIPRFQGCGCSGGGKFWRTYGSQLENNYIHDNYNVGAWWDTDNTGATITGNYIADNYAGAIYYEISYNALIANNIIVRNAIGVGQSGTITGFPIPAIYLSEAGSDSRVSGSPYGASFQVTGNQLYDNFGGVELWENSDRFCGTLSPTGDHACTLVNAGWNSNSYTSGDPCSQSGNIVTTPWIDDCRWKTQNVAVSGNLFEFVPAHIGALCTTANFCGFNGVFSQAGITSPYTGSFVENNITFNQNNLFSGNTYCGPWSFDPKVQGTTSSFAVWQGAPYNQDAGSSLNSAACQANVTVTRGGRFRLGQRETGRGGSR